MKDEIKGILEDIKEIYYFKPLLDYITNLQEENKQLKEQLEYLRSNEYLNQVKWERTFNEELVKDLQQRIDKAIEYCKKERENIIANFDYIDTKDLDNILEILGDKE